MTILKLFGKQISVATSSDDEVESNNTNLQAASSDHTPPSSDNNNNGASKKRKSRSDKGKVREINYPQVPTVNLPSEFQRIIGDGVPSVFLYRKKLEKTDVEKHQDKLQVTKKEKLMDEFLTNEEYQTLMMRREGGATSKIDVVGVDKTGRELEMLISRWGEGKVMKIVLNRNWYKMVEANGARAGHWVDLWGYRRLVDGKICIAVNFSS